MGDAADPGHLRCRLRADPRRRRRPLVDEIRLAGGMFGVLAFLLGRGLHAVLALLPMIFGAAVGAALNRRRAGGRQSSRGFARAGLVGRRACTAVAAVALLAVTAGILRPDSTDPILTGVGSPWRAASPSWSGSRSAATTKR